MKSSNILQKYLRPMFILSLCLLQSCIDKSRTNIHDNTLKIRKSFNWEVPANTRLPYTPDNNPVTEAKFQLGRHLFYDKRLSINESISCSSCHKQSLAFTDGLERSVGLNNEHHTRNAQPLINSAYFSTFTWSNNLLTSLESQISVPLFGDNPILEHGWTAQSFEDVFIPFLQSDSTYQSLLASAFPNQNKTTQQTVIYALASFIRGINAFNSPFDQFENGVSDALTDSQKRGYLLFTNDERFECFHCHSGKLFSDSYRDANMKIFDTPFHNTGLYNLSPQGDYPAESNGLIDVTGRSSDRAKFRTPTLRNIEVTAPYMHDGSIATLEEVIDFYAAGGRNLTSGRYKGDGRQNPQKSQFVKGFSISQQEKEDLINFLKSLTDQSALTNERFSDPWLKE